MRVAKMPRKLAMIWNVIPCWNGTRDVTGEELREGIKCLEELIISTELKSNVRAVVMVGGNAARAQPHLPALNTNLNFLSSAHPSPIVRTIYPEKWAAIPSIWAEALSICKY